MSETHTGQQLGVKRTTAGGGADSEAGRASHLDADRRSSATLAHFSPSW
jgi:hypothetical protein